MCGPSTTFNFNPNPYKSHFSGPEVYTSSMIYPWDEEKACTGPGSRLGPPWQGITESQVLEKWPTAGACALKGHAPWAPGTLCLVRRIQLKGPSVKARSGPLLPSLETVLETRVPYAPVFAFPTTQLHQTEIELTLALHFTVYKAPSCTILLNNPHNLVRLQHNTIW